MALLERLFGGSRPRPAEALYAAVVARAREPHWYLAGAVPDTLDGRFDMVAAVLAMVLLRLEAEPAGAAPAAHLAERFIDDMDQQMRQIGFGDIVVGKQVGRMMGMLGGRLGAYRDALAQGPEALDTPLIRNLYRGIAPSPEAIEHVRTSLLALRERLQPTSIDQLLSGALP